jgi:hypothetical protein
LAHLLRSLEPVFGALAIGFFQASFLLDEVSAEEDVLISALLLYQRKRQCCGLKLPFVWRALRW